MAYYYNGTSHYVKVVARGDYYGYSTAVAFRDEVDAWLEDNAINTLYEGMEYMVNGKYEYHFLCLKEEHATMAKLRWS